MTTRGTPTTSGPGHMAESEPVPEQLSSPRGTPLTALGWADVRTRVAEAGDFLLATTDPDGRPHVVPVLDGWHGESVCFVTFRQSRKARNLVRNSGCATARDDPRHVYALDAAQVFAFGREEGFSATRWRPSHIRNDERKHR